MMYRTRTSGTDIETSYVMAHGWDGAAVLVDGYELIDVWSDGEEAADVRHDVSDTDIRHGHQDVGADIGAQDVSSGREDVSADIGAQRVIQTQTVLQPCAPRGPLPGWVARSKAALLEPVPSWWTKPRNPRVQTQKVTVNAPAVKTEGEE